MKQIVMTQTVNINFTAICGNCAKSSKTESSQHYCSKPTLEAENSYWRTVNLQNLLLHLQLLSLASETRIMVLWEVTG
jgi:hypothetical protein